LTPTFQSYAVPISYSYQSAVPVGVVQRTYQVTDPQAAALVGAVQQYTTDTLVQVPVQATALYAAPAVTYSTPLLYSATTGYADRALFFDRATLGVSYGGSYYGNYGAFGRFSNAYNRAFFATGFNNGGVAIANGRRGLAVAAGGPGGNSVAIAQSRGILGRNREAIAVNGGGGAAVAQANGGLGGRRSATAVAGNGGVAVAHAGRR
jgi:hypothetical protein